jgi:hypothetical protein
VNGIIRHSVIKMLLKQAEEQSAYDLAHRAVFGRKPLMHRNAPDESVRIALAQNIIWC